MMNYRMLAGLTTLAASLSLFLYTSDLRAEGEQSLKGTVSVMENDDGDIEAVSLKVTEGKDRGTFKVTLDEKGKALAEKAAGESVEVSAILTQKGKEKWLKITRYKIVEDAEELEDN
jgi:hypothetical protein